MNRIPFTTLRRSKKITVYVAPRSRCWTDGTGARVVTIYQRPEGTRAMGHRRLHRLVPHDDEGRAWLAEQSIREGAL